jgi:hypothetical protein
LRSSQRTLFRRSGFQTAAVTLKKQSGVDVVHRTDDASDSPYKQSLKLFCPMYEPLSVPPALAQYPVNQCAIEQSSPPM